VPAAAKSEVVAIAAGIFHCVALKSDGSLVTWGGNVNGEVKLPASLPPAFAIAASYGLTVALVHDPAPALTILRNADQTLSLSWSGVGTLEQSEGLSAPNWQPAPSQSNPQTIRATEAVRFFRVKAERRDD
jgi:hypothetical protein